MGTATETWHGDPRQLLGHWRRRRERLTCDPRYRHLFEPGGTEEWVALDCETTGLDTRHADMVALAAVKVVDDRVLTSSALNLRLQPPKGLDEDSIRIHGLREIDLRGGEPVGDALNKLLDFIGNRPLLGWCLEFDLAVINRQLRPRFGFSLPNRVVDVRRQYLRHWRRVHPTVEPDLRFERVAGALGVPVLERHTALGDAVTAGLMFLSLSRQV